MRGHQVYRWGAQPGWPGGRGPAGSGRRACPATTPGRDGTVRRLEPESRRDGGSFIVLAARSVVRFPLARRRFGIMPFPSTFPTAPTIDQAVNRRQRTSVLAGCA